MSKAPLVVATCALAFVAAAEAHHRPTTSDLPDIAAIQPADILFVGDSQNLGYFGAQLYRSLSAEHDPKSGRAFAVWGLWACGSDVDDWLNGGRSECGIRVCDGKDRCVGDYGPLDGPGNVRYAALGAYAAKVHPRITILSMGSNLLTWSLADFRGEYASYLRNAGRLADQIAQGGSRCVWIGPPQPALKAKPDKTYVKFTADLARAVTDHGCAFIDSGPLSDRKYVLRGDPEGIHYQSAGERLWEKNVWAQLRPLLNARTTR